MRTGEGPPALQPARTALEEHDFLPTTGPDRLHESSAVRDLIRERLRNPRERRGDDDRLERRLLGKPLGPVPDDDPDVLAAVPTKVVARRARKILPALDAPDEAGEAGEHSRLKAVPGTDLEDPLGPGERQPFDHPRHERRLRRHLAVWDGERLVEVRAPAEIHRDEAGAGHCAEGRQDTLVGDPLGSQDLDEIGLGRARHAVSMVTVERWPVAPQELIARQTELGRTAPESWSPVADALVGGCFLCFGRGASGPGRTGEPGWAAAALVRSGELVGSALVAGKSGWRYEARLLGLREGPLLEAAVRALPQRPEVVLVDATGRDHPRRAGLALQLGAVLDLPSIGITHRPLVAEGGWPPDERGARTPLLLEGETVGYWLRTRRGTRPLAVHAAWRTDPDVAAAVVLACVRGARTPEPLRQARRVARTARARAR